MDPLIKAAVMHYQFEAIHPYHDGNGRTGRILLILYLVEQGLLRMPVLYLSRFIIERKSDYYRLLRGVTEDGAWEPWVLFMLEGTRATSELTIQRIAAIREAFEATCELAKREMGRGYSKDLIEVVFSQPYCKIQFLIDAGIAKRQSASHYLRDLERIGVLHSFKVGNEKSYVNMSLLELLST